MTILCVAAPVALASGVAAEPWTRRYVNALPDSAFAAVEESPDGKKIRHLPHHDRDGRVDLPHVRNGLSRLPQVHWLDPGHAAAAREHLRQHVAHAHAGQAQP